ncbi:hypothetical protein [Moorena sp. SIO3A2]|uniref:hypothetical protein n=1 Tax=Moorena sp. SIO3A2 TaxID=2607841 RepID=UPI00257C286B|nr:hypothetical protein [Moorena sp. SIO3A2]
MIAVDTNVVVRLLTQDDQLQFNKSVEIFRKQEVFIADTVILETEWVLRFAYKFKPAAICQGLRNLFGLPKILGLKPRPYRTAFFLFAFGGSKGASMY